MRCPKHFFCSERAFCRSKMGQVRHCLWPDRNLKFFGPHCLWPDRTIKFSGPHCLWPDRNIKFAGPHCLWPDRNIKFAGPHCLWPDRGAHLRAPRRTSLPMAGPDTRFGTYKVSKWREGVQPQKTWIQKTICRILRPFHLLLALYARVLSKPGAHEMCIPCL